MTGAGTLAQRLALAALLAWPIVGGASRTPVATDHEASAHVTQVLREAGYRVTGSPGRIVARHPGCAAGVGVGLKAINSFVAGGPDPDGPDAPVVVFGDWQGLRPSRLTLARQALAIQLHAALAPSRSAPASLLLIASDPSACLIQHAPAWRRIWFGG